MPTLITITGSAVASIEIASPWITLVPCPVVELCAIDFTGRIGIVVGSEGHGLKRLTREACDFIARLPMQGAVASLNAGVAAGVALYEVARGRLGGRR